MKARELNGPPEPTTASGPADGLGNGAAFTCEALKLDCQIVPGYGGSAQSGLAVTRGEMDAVYVPESSANNFVKAKQNLAIATIGRKKSRWFLDKPTIFEAVELNEDARWLFDFFTGVEEMGRIMMVPPNMPKARLAYLQAAIKETLHKPQLIAEGRAHRAHHRISRSREHAQERADHRVERDTGAEEARADDFGPEQVAVMTQPSWQRPTWPKAGGRS